MGVEASPYFLFDSVLHKEDGATPLRSLADSTSPDSAYTRMFEYYDDNNVAGSSSYRLYASRWLHNFLWNGDVNGTFVNQNFMNLQTGANMNLRLNASPTQSAGSELLSIYDKNGVKIGYVNDKGSNVIQPADTSTIGMTITLPSGGTYPNLRFDSPNGTTKIKEWTTATLPRWREWVGGTESGSSTGSYYVLSGFDDSLNQYNVLVVNRNDGMMAHFGYGVQSNSGAGGYAGSFSAANAAHEGVRIYGTTGQSGSYLVARDVSSNKVLELTSGGQLCFGGDASGFFRTSSGQIAWAGDNGVYSFGTAGTTGFITAASGDGFYRWYVQHNGNMLWGSGAAAVDTSFYRIGVGQLALSGNGMFSHGSTATNVGYGVMVNGDAYQRWDVRQNGTMYWGSGSAAEDVVLYRSSANILATDDQLLVKAPFTNWPAALFRKLASATANIVEVQDDTGTLLSGFDSSGYLRYASGLTTTSVGAAGGASALPATPLGYMYVNINGTARRVPYYN